MTGTPCPRGADLGSPLSSPCDLCPEEEGRRETWGFPSMDLFSSPFGTACLLASGLYSTRHHSHRACSAPKPTSLTNGLGQLEPPQFGRYLAHKSQSCSERCPGGEPSLAFPPGCFGIFLGQLTREVLACLLVAGVEHILSSQMGPLPSAQCPEACDPGGAELWVWLIWPSR